MTLISVPHSVEVCTKPGTLALGYIFMCTLVLKLTVAEHKCDPPAVPFSFQQIPHIVKSHMEESNTVLKKNCINFCEICLRQQCKRTSSETERWDQGFHKI